MLTFIVKLSNNWVKNEYTCRAFEESFVFNKEPKVIYLNYYVPPKYYYMKISYKTYFNDAATVEK